MMLRFSLVAFACLIPLSINLSYAQEYEPIGRHYANRITLLPPESEQKFMSSAEVLDINNDGKDDVVFSGSGASNIDPCLLFNIAFHPFLRVRINIVRKVYYS